MEWADRAVAYLMAGFSIWIYFRDRDPPEQDD